MPLFLAGLLVRSGAVSSEVMEEALQRQVLYGGALDTNLLEIAAIDDATLAPYLARASGLSLAPPEAFSASEPGVRRAFPGRLAERHGLVPFQLEGRTLDVASSYPVEGSLIDEISFMLSLILRPHVAAEFRVRLAIERMYGHPAAQRFHALAARFETGAAAPASSPPEVPHPEDPAAQARTTPSWTTEEARELLRAAKNRDEAIEIVLRFSRRVFEYASAFVIVSGNVIGWDAIGPDPAAHRRATQVAFPVDAPSILRTVVETGGRYLGPIPADEHHGALLEALGRRPPRSAYLQPVAIGDRVVAIVLCENGEKVVSPRQVSQVMQVVQELSSVLHAMILSRRGALAGEAAAVPESLVQPAAAAPPAPPAPSRPPPARSSATPTSTEVARRAVEALLTARSEQEQEAAFAILESSGRAAAEMLVALLPGGAGGPLTPERAASPTSPLVIALQRLGDRALPVLLAARTSSSPAVRFWVAALLARSSAPAAREALATLARDRSPEVARVASS